MWVSSPPFLPRGHDAVSFCLQDVTMTLWSRRTSTLYHYFHEREDDQSLCPRKNAMIELTNIFRYDMDFGGSFWPLCNFVRNVDLQGEGKREGNRFGVM